jgi:predicted short-subunit dehydrogenase-like oxidoreductase (DUF2520 family)
MIERPTLGIIGVGKVGNTLGRLAHRAGYRIEAVCSRDAAKAGAFAADVGARVVQSPAEVLPWCQIVLLTVADDAILPVVKEMLAALREGAPPGIAIIHTSGSRELDMFDALNAFGMTGGSLHPAFPFTGSEIESVAGAAFAIEIDDAIVYQWLEALVIALGGVPLRIPRGSKALYHAALVMASNYLVVLYALAERLLGEMKVDRETAKAALLPLMRASLDNIAAQGVPAALPGPLVRGDAGTVAANLAALVNNPEARAIYKALALAALPMAQARGVETEALRATIEASR